MKNIKKLIIKYGEQIRYLFVGGITTLINFIALIILSKIFNLQLMFSNTIAWLLSITWAFFANKSIVYKSKYTNLVDFFRELISFFGARLFSLFLDDGFMFVGVKLLHQNEIFIKIIDEIVVIIVNYILGKIIFHHKEEQIEKNNRRIINNENLFNTKFKKESK